MPPGLPRAEGRPSRVCLSRLVSGFAGCSGDVALGVTRLEAACSESCGSAEPMPVTASSCHPLWWPRTSASRPPPPALSPGARQRRCVVRTASAAVPRAFTGGQGSASPVNMLAMVEGHSVFSWFSRTSCRFVRGAAGARTEAGRRAVDVARPVARPPASGAASTRETVLEPVGTCFHAAGQATGFWAALPAGMRVPSPGGVGEGALPVSRCRRWPWPELGPEGQAARGCWRWPARSAPGPCPAAAAQISCSISPVILQTLPRLICKQ